MEDDYTTNSHYLTYTFLFKVRVRRKFTRLFVQFVVENSSPCSLVVIATGKNWMAYRKDIAFELRNHDIFVRHYSTEPAFHSGRLVHRTVVERYSSLIGRGVAVTLNNTSTTQNFSV